MAETLTRADLEWKEHSIRVRVKQLHRLTPEQAEALRQIDRIREEKGWGGEEGVEC